MTPGTLNGTVANASPVRVTAATVRATSAKEAAAPPDAVRFERDRFPAGTGTLGAAQTKFELTTVPESASQHLTRTRSGVTLVLDEGVDYTLVNATVTLTAAADVGDVIEARYATYGAPAPATDPSIVGANAAFFTNGDMSIGLVNGTAQAGDRIFALWTNSEALVTQVTTGWTEIVSATSTNGGSELKVQLFTRIATATEPAEYTFNGPANDNHVALIFAVRGVEATLGLAVRDGGAFARSATVTFPDLTSDYRHKVLWFAGMQGGAGGDAALSAPARGSIIVQDDVADSTIVAVSGPARAAGTEASNTITAPSADTYAVGISVSLRY